MPDESAPTDQGPEPSPLDLSGELPHRPRSPFTLDAPLLIERERTRGLDDLARSLIALALTILFGVTIVLAFAKTGNATTWANAKDLLNMLLPAETGILGSALGYYFGTRDRQRQDRHDGP